MVDFSLHAERSGTYLEGQIWEDNDGDQWRVDGGRFLAIGSNPYAGVHWPFSDVERTFKPLTLVQDAPLRWIIGLDPRHVDDHVAAVLSDNADPRGGQFVTKDSGEREVYSTGMQRDTSGKKARFDLLFPLGLPYEAQMLTRFAELMQRGAEKYDSRNWEKAGTEEELTRFKESATRHFIQWLTGETDEDHAAAVWFNILAFETTKWKVNN